jgi:hypothetical protein
MRGIIGTASIGVAVTVTDAVRVILAVRVLVAVARGVRVILWRIRNHRTTGDTRCIRNRRTTGDAGGTSRVSDYE